MFTAKVKADVIKHIIDVTSPLVTEAKFNVTNEGISLRAVDPAHVAMVELNLKKEAFTEYTASEMELGIDLDKLGGIMKLASNTDIVDLTYDEKNNRMIIKFGNLTRRMALLDTAGMPDSKVPTLELPAIITVNVSEINKGVKASESISDHLAITAEPEHFLITAEGDTDTVDLKLTKDQLVSLKTDSAYKSMFSIDYFHNMIKPVRGNEPITIHLGNDNPIRVDFKIASENGDVTYLLAPRIESD